MSLGSLFSLVIFQVQYHTFAQGRPQTTFLLLTVSQVAGRISTNHFSRLWIKMGSNFFAQTGPKLWSFQSPPPKWLGLQCEPQHLTQKQFLVCVVIWCSLKKAYGNLCFERSSVMSAFLCIFLNISWSKWLFEWKSTLSQWYNGNVYVHMQLSPFWSKNSDWNSWIVFKHSCFLMSC
jgi:hypothetical protein